MYKGSIKPDVGGDADRRRGGEGVVKEVARGGGPPEATALNKSELALSLLALEAGYPKEKKNQGSTTSKDRNERHPFSPRGDYRWPLTKARPLLREKTLISLIRNTYLESKIDTNAELTNKITNT